MQKKDLISGMKNLNKLGAKLVVITIGTKGAVAYDGKRIYHQKGYKVKVTDSTGCGDSFTAGFLHSILKEKAIVKALKFANASAALQCLYVGSESLPEKEILKFISKH
jgi:sugar/nucleoside kinase (ribokinase family)